MPSNANVAAGLLYKAGSDHVHTPDEVMGFGEAVGERMREAMPEIDLEAEVTLTDSAKSVRLFDGQALSRGIYAAEITTEIIDKTGSWTTIPSVTSRLSAGGSLYATLGVMSIGVSRPGSSAPSPSYDYSLAGTGFVYVPEDRTIGSESTNLSFVTSSNLIQTGCTISVRVTLKMRKLI